MQTNAYQVFRLDHSGSMRAVRLPYATQELAEESIKIPPEIVCDVFYVVLPIYTNSQLLQGADKKMQIGAA